MEDFSLISACNTLQKVKSDVTVDYEDLGNYLKQGVTKDTAKYYMDLMENLNGVLEKTKVNKKTKEAASLLFNTILMKSCESECRGEMLNELGKNNLIMAERIKYLTEQWQKEREEHNKLLEENKKAVKSEKVELPALELSIILRDPKKKLTNREVCRVFNDSVSQLDTIDEKFTYMNVSNEKVSRAYVKKSNDGVDKVYQRGSASKKSK